MKIRIGIFGYGNLGRAAAFAVRAQEDMMLAGVFSRRDPEMIPDKVPDVPFFPATMLFGENTPTKMDVFCFAAAAHKICRRKRRCWPGAFASLTVLIHMRPPWRIF